MKFWEKKGPSLGVIQPSRPHERSPSAPKFEDQSQEETLRQERCARRDAWELTRSVQKLNKKHKATCFSPSDVWCLPAPSSVKPEENEFVVDSGASMHMISRRALNSAELEIVRVSRYPTKVRAASGKCKRTRMQQSTSTIWIYSRRKSSSRTRRQLLSLGKSLRKSLTCSHGWTRGQKPHLFKHGRKTPCNTENYVPIVVLGWSTESSSSSAESTSSTPVSQDGMRDNSTLPRAAKTRSRRKRREGREDLEQDPNKNKKNRDNDETQGDQLYDLPEPLTEKLPPKGKRKQAALTSRLIKNLHQEVSGKHSIFTHFPKDRKCEVWKRTESTSSRKNGDLITANHKSSQRGA